MGQVSTAFFCAFLGILASEVRVLLHQMLQRGAAKYVTRASVGEGPIGDPGAASQIDLFTRVEARLLFQPMHHVGPNNVPGILSLGYSIYTLFLRDVTLLLAPVQVEIGDSIFISLVNFRKSIVQVIWAHLLFLS
ncbi:hypothetical protein RRF57_007863 [Xylaria bambusicola]|uniref:Uncharacterized protein n=1 Tax=Xylaria bambusicola TaxID=326684 RepID=A0AAN7Z060_9PEZI